MDIAARRVTALIGPSGCGKTTLLRCFNRMNDLVAGARIEGTILIEGEDIYGPGVDVTALRRRVGMVFQRSNPFPMSIFDNVAYGPRLAGVRDRRRLAEVVESSLRAAALWEEVKDRLRDSALSLSGGQQQRLCIARALAVEPSILLMDEPCSALDPIATARIEELILQLKERYTWSSSPTTCNRRPASRTTPRFCCRGSSLSSTAPRRCLRSPGAGKPGSTSWAGLGKGPSWWGRRWRKVGEGEVPVRMGHRWNWHRTCPSRAKRVGKPPCRVE